jgi:CBS domain containing-hemolysin-like protein
VRLDTLGDLIGRELEHPEIDTVSGLILSELGRPAVFGDAVEWNGVRFEVSGVYGRGVRQATLVLETPQASADRNAER